MLKRSGCITPIVAACQQNYNDCCTLQNDVLSSAAMRYSSTISDKDQQPICENRIQFGGRESALASFPGFMLVGDISG
jgi:hypothetical protein